MCAYWKCLLLAALCFINLGCSKSDNTSPTPASAGPPQATSLEDRIIKLRIEVAKLQSRLNDLQSGQVTVNTDEKAYNIAQTKFGSFAVICKNVTPYLDGYKIVLEIGNLTSGTFQGATLVFEYGNNGNGSKTIEVSNIFLPGRYSNVEVILTPAKPEDIKTITVYLQFNGMALARYN
jgi:hypothetical protein